MPDRHDGPGIGYEEWALNGLYSSDLYTHVMDISSLDIGPENYKGKR